MIDAAVLTPRASEAPLQAQEAADGASAPGPGIRLVDLSDYPTHTTVDRFEVEVVNLSATAAYQVIVSSDSAGLGIGACGTASHTETVTGVAAQTLTFFLYVCTEDSGTLTAEVRRTGASSAEAAVSQRLTVLAVPEGAPGGTTGAPAARAARGAVARVGTPGTVPSISFPTADRRHTSIKVTWGKPSNGGRALTGFGLLWWTGNNQPGYGTALVKGAAAREHTYTGLQANTTYKFRIHACNGPDSCGWWTDPPREVTTPPEPTTAPTATAAPVGTPHAPHSLRYTDRLATSFTVHWSPHANTGGRPLTGFGILRWEKPGDRPSDSQATVVGAGSRSQPVTGLKYGREQRVRIRACNGTNRCSAWSSELTVPAMAGLLPTIALPKTSIEIGEQISVGANDLPVGAVAWLRFEGPIQPRGRCGASGTARAPAVPRDPSPSTGPGYYDSAWIEGCAPGGEAVIRLEAQDGSVLYDRRTLQVVRDTPPPGEMHITSLTADTSSFTVNWAPPQNTDGETITGYDVLWRQSGSSWVENAATRLLATARSHTVMGLDTNITYVVKVRACYGSTTCWDWSADGRITTVVSMTTMPPGPPVPITPVIQSCGSERTGPLAAPQVFNVFPQPGRSALLTWVGDASALYYDVKISEVGSSNRRTYRVTEPCYTIRLDSIIVENPTRGLQHASRFQFQVEAHDSNGNVERSKTITIVDTPITSANGHSPSSAKAVISWTKLTDGRFFNSSSYAAGTYELRYRPLGSNYSASKWQPNTFGHYLPNVTASGSASAHTRTSDLVVGQIYAVQLVYKEGSSTLNDTDTFAARDVYVWPSASPRLSFGSDAGVWHVGFYFLYPRPTRTYQYRICSNTFPDGPSDDPDKWKNKWSDTIQHALGQWQLATDGLVIMQYDRNPCVDYSEKIDELVSDVVISAEELGFSTRIILDRIRRFVGQNWLWFLDRKVLENGVNEIIMFDNVDPGNYRTLESYLQALAQHEFPEVAGVVGALGFAESPGCYEADTVACAPPSRQEQYFPSARSFATDIFLIRSKLEGDPLDLPGGDTTVDPDDIRFNSCPSLPLPPVPRDFVELGVRPMANSDGTYSAYGVLVHESGHALGLYSHPEFRETAMAPAKGLGCSPHPLDVMAVRALYEAR